MKLDENLGVSIDYAKKMFADLGRLVILIVLNFIPIVNLIVAGYAWRVIRESPSSKDPPPLERYGEMWVNGLKVAGASFIYMIIPIIIIVSGVYFEIARMGVRRAFFFILTATGIITILVGVVLVFLLAIILAMGIVHMIKYNSFGKAFAFGEIFAIIKKIGWGKYIAWLIVVFVLAIVVGGISGIPMIGWLISLVIHPIFTVFAARSAALIYCDGAPEVCAPPVAPSVPIPTAPPPPSPAAPPPSGFVYCPSCGAKLPEGATFCPKCGQKLQAQ